MLLTVSEVLSLVSVIEFQFRLCSAFSILQYNFTNISLLKNAFHILCIFQLFSILLLFAKFHLVKYDDAQSICLYIFLYVKN